MLRKIAISALLLSVPVWVWAQTISAPAIKAADTWTYRVTSEKGPTGWVQTRDETTVSRVTGSTIYYTVKASGSTQPERSCSRESIGAGRATSTAKKWWSTSRCRSR